MTFLEITKEDLITNYGFYDDLLIFQNSLMKIYSRKLFNREFPFEMISRLTEPIKDVFVIDVFETFFKYLDFSFFDMSDLEELKQLSNYEKIIEFINIISFENNIF